MLLASPSCLVLTNSIGTGRAAQGEQHKVSTDEAPAALIYGLILGATAQAKGLRVAEMRRGEINPDGFNPYARD